ncbi:MAG: cardiolipin synthase, partial [Lacunisphaera sp.]|nr:cardiolipin synthase [Lacunisphaera sp.]
LIGTGLVIVVMALFFWHTSAMMVGKPVELDYGPASPVFANSLGPLLSAEFTIGNKVELLTNGDQFFPVMLAAIASAKKSITLETYIWSSGKISDQFIAALTERAQHGVKVHALVDGMGALHFKKEDQHRLLEGGVEFIYYGREHWYELKPNINHRTHRKLLIIDGQVGFTGGMCIDDLWMGNATQKDHWRETQIRVEGPAVRQMQAVFTSNWLLTTTKLLIGPDYFATYEGPRNGSLVQCYKSGPNQDPENARISYLAAIAGARKSLRISHAYFVPDDLAIEMLLAARKRGVDIQVIIPAHNDSRFGRAASRSRWGKLLEAGVEFYRYEPAMYHCKTMLVDDVFMTIGSVNFDNRSFGINDEVAVNVLDRDLARAGLRQFEDDLKHSERLTLEEFNARPGLQKLVDQFCGLFRSQL